LDPRPEESAQRLDPASASVTDQQLQLELHWKWQQMQSAQRQRTQQRREEQRRREQEREKEQLREKQVREQTDMLLQLQQEELALSQWEQEEEEQREQLRREQLEAELLYLQRQREYEQEQLHLLQKWLNLQKLRKRNQQHSKEHRKNPAVPLADGSVGRTTLKRPDELESGSKRGLARPKQSWIRQEDVRTLAPIGDRNGDREGTQRGWGEGGAIFGEHGEGLGEYAEGANVVPSFVDDAAGTMDRRKSPTSSEDVVLNDAAVSTGDASLDGLAVVNSPTDRDSDLPIRRRYKLYSRCSKRYVRFVGDHIDALASFDDIYGETNHLICSSNYFCLHLQ